MNSVGALRNLAQNLADIAPVAKWVQGLDGLRHLEGFALSNWQLSSPSLRIGHPVFRLDLWDADSVISSRVKARRREIQEVLSTKPHRTFSRGLYEALQEVSSKKHPSHLVEWAIYSLEQGGYILKRGIPGHVARERDPIRKLIYHTHDAFFAIPSTKDLSNTLRQERWDIIHKAAASPSSPSYKPSVSHEDICFLFPVGQHRVHGWYWLDWKSSAESRCLSVRHFEFDFDPKEGSWLVKSHPLLPQGSGNYSHQFREMRGIDVSSIIFHRPLHA